MRYPERIADCHGWCVEVGKIKGLVFLELVVFEGYLSTTAVGQVTVSTRVERGSSFPPGVSSLLLTALLHDNTVRPLFPLYKKEADGVCV